MSELVKTSPANAAHCDDDKLICETNHYRRARYFHGMLLSDRDFKEEQTYHIEKRHLLNRMLHGWGIVCGLTVEKKKKLIVTVNPGMALDCHGNEIVVCDPVDIDLKPCITTRSGKKPVTPQDCEEREKRSEPKTFYIGICYREKTTAPVPAYVPDGSCEDKECEFSRIQEGFCICVLEYCPDRWAKQDAKDDLFACFDEERDNPDYSDKSDDPKDPNADEKTFEQHLRDCFAKLEECPDCCPDTHCVGLGKVTIDLDNQDQPIVIDMDECRRYLCSPRLLKCLVTDLVCEVVDLDKRVRALERSKFGENKGGAEGSDENSASERETGK